MSTYPTATPVGPVPPVQTPRAQATAVAEQARQTKIAAVYEDTAKLNQMSQSWNPFSYLGAIPASLKSWLDRRSLASGGNSQQDLALADADLAKPTIEQYAALKYDAPIQASKAAEKALLAKSTPTPQNPILASQGPSGPGTAVTQLKPSNKPQPVMEQMMETRGLQAAKVQETAQLDDIAVLHALVARNSLPKPGFGERLGQGVDALSDSLLGVSTEGLRNPRVVKAEEQAYPKGTAQKAFEGAMGTAGLLIRYEGLNAGSAMLGSSLRSVQAIDDAYKAYPYAMKALVANIGSNAGDALTAKLAGKDYTSKDFMINMLAQGTLESLGASQKARILTHLDNEAHVLETRLGRPARADEFLSQIVDQHIPGQNFTYGHLFGEQRLAYLNNPKGFLAEAAPGEVEKRLAFLKTGGATMTRPPVAHDLQLAGPESIPADLETRPRPAGPLSEQQKKLESASFQYLGANKDRVYSKYDAAAVENPRAVFMAGGTGAGKTHAVNHGDLFSGEPFVNVASDNLKEDFLPVAQALGFPEQDMKSFLRAHAQAVHEPSSDASKELFMTRIGESKNVLFDSNLTSTSAGSRIQAALDSGKPVDIVYVHRNPVEAYVNGVLPRMEKTGRFLPLDEHVARHVDAPANFLKLYDEFKDKGVSFKVFDNTADGYVERPVDFIRKLTYTADDVRKDINTALGSEATKLGETVSGEDKLLQARSGEAGAAVGDGLRGGEGGAGGGGGGLGGLTPEPDEFKNLQDVPGIRIAKLTSDGAKDAFHQIMEAYPEILQSRSRGVISHAETIEAAAKVGMTRERLMGLKPGAVLNNQEMQAARSLMSADLQDLNLLRKAAEVEAQAGESTVAQSEAMKGMFEHELGRLSLQGARVSGAATEAGRALNSLKIKMAPLERAQERFQETFQTAPKKVKEAMYQYAKDVDMTNEKDLRHFLMRFNDKGFMDAVAEFTQMAKLYSFLPQSRNFISNLGWQAAQVGWRPYVAAVDAARAAVTGGPRERFFGEIGKEIRGQLQGTGKAFGVKLAREEAGDARIMGMELSVGEFWKALGDEFYTNEPGGGNLEDMIGRLPAIRGTTGNAWIDKTVDATGKVIRLPGRALNAVDVAFYRIAYQAEAGVQAYRIAKGEGLAGGALKERVAKILQMPDPDLLKSIHLAAADRVFHSDLGPIAQKINSFRFMPVIGPVFRTGPLAFFKTPINIFKKTIGPFNPMLLARGLRAGGGEASEALARSSVGVLTTGLLFKYAMNGYITGATPYDPKLRDELQQHGWQRYSVLIGGKYYYYNSTDPVSAPLMYATALADSYRSNGGQIDARTFSQMLLNISKGTLDKTYAKGISSLMNALKNPQQDGPAWIRDYTAGLLPLAPGRAVLSFTDTDKNGNQIQREGKGVIGNIQSQIPGLAEQLPPRLDYQGRVMTRPGSAIGRVTNPLSPTQLVVPVEELNKMQEDFYRIQGYSRDARSASAEQRQKARVFLATQSGLPPELIQKNMTTLVSKNPEIAKIVKDLIDQRMGKKGTLPYSLRDDVLQSAPIDARAAFIFDEMKRMVREGSGANLAAQLADWKRKKILTPETEKRVTDLFRKSVKPSSPAAVPSSSPSSYY